MIGTISGFDPNPERRAGERQSPRIPSFRAELRGVLQGCNHGFLDLLGYTEAGQVVGKPWSHLLSKAEDGAALVGELEERGAFSSAEVHLRRADGRSVCVLLNATLLGEDDGGGSGREFHASALDITRQKQAQEELRLHVEILREQVHLLDLPADGIILRDMEGYIRFWSRGAEKIYGWTREEAMGQPVSDLLRTKFPIPRTEIEAQMLARGHWEGELVHLRRNGSTVIVSSRWALQTKAEGGPLGILEVNTDVTGRKRAELRQELQLNVAQLLSESSTLEALSPRLLDIIGSQMGWQASELWVVDPEGDGLVCHSTWSAGDLSEPTLIEQTSKGMKIASGEGLPGRAWQDGELVWLKDAASSPEFLRPALASDLGVRGAFAVPLPVRQQVAGVLCFYQHDEGAPDESLHRIIADIGLQIGQFIERCHSEQELRKSEVRFRSLLASAPDPIVITDSTGRMVLANHQTELQFGYSSDELMGRPVELLLPERFRLHHQHHRDGYTRHPSVRPMGVGLELLARRKDGREFPVEVSLSPLHVDQELLIIAVVRDISARKREEEALRELHQLQLAQTEHLATMGEIAAGLAHEIKNPLAGIAAALEILGAELAADEASRDIMAEVQQQVLRIKGTVDELLNYARPRPLQLACGDLNKSIEHVVHFAQQQAVSHGVELVFVPGQLPPVVHDLDQIQRVVLNLVLNSIEASSGGCRVEVRSEYETNPSGDGIARIIVRDNGPGMDAETLQKIFRPFFTTKGIKGTGLGLSLCRRIAELHRGRIDAESQLGIGSTFTISLPNPASALLESPDVPS